MKGNTAKCWMRDDVYADVCQTSQASRSQGRDERLKGKEEERVCSGNLPKSQDQDSTSRPVIARGVYSGAQIGLNSAGVTSQRRVVDR